MVLRRYRWAAALPVLAALLCALTSVAARRDNTPVPGAGRSVVAMVGVANAANLVDFGTRPGVRLLGVRGVGWLAGGVMAAGPATGYRLSRSAASSPVDPVSWACAHRLAEVCSARGPPGSG